MMKKISIIFIAVVVLLTIANPFLYFLHRNSYLEENTLNVDISENLEICKSGNLKVTHNFYRDDLIALFSELQQMEYILIKPETANRIINSTNIDENVTYTSVPTMYEEEPEKALSSIQLFEFDNVNYILCKYELKYNKSVYSLFSFSPSEKLTDLLKSNILYSHGNFKLNRTWSKEGAVKTTAKNFIPIIIAALIMFIPYIIKGKSAKKALVVMTKLGFIVIPIMMTIVYFNMYLT